MNSNSFEGVIILGMPRSGTTLMRRLLNAHPQLACPPETNLLSSASHFLKEAEFAGGLSLGVVSGLSFSGFEKEEILSRLREFVFGFMRDILKKTDKRYWVEKTAVDIFYIDAIESLCGDRCRYVCIVRHPLDVICSLADLSRKMQSYLPEIYEYTLKHRSPIEAYAHAWVDANANLLDFLEKNPDNTVLIRYEDLVQSPTTEIGRVCDFLKEPANCEELVARALDNRDSVGLGDWKTYEKSSISSESVDRHGELGMWTIKKLAPILNPLLPRLGYDEIAEGGLAEDQNDERSKALARLVAGMKFSETGGTPEEQQ